MDGMKGFEFELYFKNIPFVKNAFLSVVAVDQIPKVIPVRHFVICNLSPAHLSGSHWICIVRSDKDIIEIFNSLGSPNLDYIKNFLKFTKRLEIEYNEQQFQSQLSSTCGYFCIYFAIQRVINFDMPFEHLLEHIFELTPDTNEVSVVNFCTKLKNNQDISLFD